MLRLLLKHKLLYIVTLTVAVFITASIYFYIDSQVRDDTVTVGFVDASAATIGSYDLISQAFAVFADVEQGDRLDAVLDAIEALWDGDAQILKLLSPPFSHKGEKYPGYIRDYPKGIRENGGQYTHAAMWGVIALFIGGRERAAQRMLLKLCPAEKCSDVRDGRRYAIEPYVLSGDVYSCGERAGRGGWSWYTGAAGWMMKAIEIIFGKSIDKNKKQ